MLTTEDKTTYQTQIGDAVVTITSESPQGADEDMLDALVRLIKRDIAGVETTQK